jgi:hypothetical protein
MILLVVLKIKHAPQLTVSGCLVWLFLMARVPTMLAQGCTLAPEKYRLEKILPLQQGVFRVPTALFNTAYPTDHPRLSTPRPAPQRGVFLPHWSAEALPFFCKIEYDWSKNRSRIPMKFRLGSVEYVDWLEGKN